MSYDQLIRMKYKIITHVQLNMRSDFEYYKVTGMNRVSDFEVNAITSFDRVLQDLWFGTTLQISKFALSHLDRIYPPVSTFNLDNGQFFSKISPNLPFPYYINGIKLKIYDPEADAMLKLYGVENIENWAKNYIDEDPETTDRRIDQLDNVLRLTPIVRAFEKNI